MEGVLDGLSVVGVRVGTQDGAPDGELLGYVEGDSDGITLG